MLCFSEALLSIYTQYPPFCNPRSELFCIQGHIFLPHLINIKHVRAHYARSRVEGGLRKETAKAPEEPLTSFRDPLTPFRGNFTRDYWCPVKSTEPKVDDSQGAKDHRRGCQPPGQDDLTIISPERESEFITCLVTTCLWLCRPFRTFSFIAPLPGVYTPVCGLSSLRDFWQAAGCFHVSSAMRL